jgi:GMP reductase
MAKITTDIKLDFSDVLMIPKRSELGSRSEVSLERTFHFKHSGRTWTGVPIAVSNMDMTGTIEMALELQKHKMLTCLHKYYTADDIPNTLNPEYYAVSVGIGERDLERLASIVSRHNPSFICVDVANGYSVRFQDTVRRIRETYPSHTIIAGNVVTPEMVSELLIHCGVDIVKIGIGSGSVCTTRIQTGVGYPQFSAILECMEVAHGLNGMVMSDGGVRCPGDIAKAFGAGADFVMAGSMFAGYNESGGNIVELENGKQVKEFYGMSSAKAMDKYAGGVARYRSAEGRSIHVDYKGPVENQVLNIAGGLRSTMTYIGARMLKHIPKCASFIRVNHQVSHIPDKK